MENGKSSAFFSIDRHRVNLTKATTHYVALSTNCLSLHRGHVSIPSIKLYKLEKLAMSGSTSDLAN
jgi:hypothetical protein